MKISAVLHLAFAGLLDVYSHVSSDEHTGDALQKLFYIISSILQLRYGGHISRYEVIVACLLL